MLALHCTQGSRSWLLKSLRKVCVVLWSTAECSSLAPFRKWEADALWALH